MPRRRLLLAGFPLLVFASQVVWITYSPVASRAAVEWGVSKESVGFLAVLFPLAYILMAYPAGWLLDRSVAKAMALASVLFAATAVARIIAPHSYEWVLAGQVAAAMAQPLAVNGIAPYASSYFPEPSRPMAVSAGSASMYAGMIFGMAAGAPVYERWGLEGLAYYSSAITLAGAILTILMIRLVPGEDGGSGSHLPTLRSIRVIASRRDVWVLAILLGIGLAVLDILLSWIEPVFDKMGIARYAGTAAAVMILAGVAGASLLPSVAARMGRRRDFLTVAAFSGVVAYGMATVTGDPYVLMALMAFNGFLLMAGLPIIFEWVESSTPRGMQGETVGVIMLVSHVLAVAALAMSTPLIEDPFVFFASLSGLALVATLVTRLLPAR